MTGKLTEADHFYGKNTVTAGSSDQTVLSGGGLAADQANLTYLYATYKYFRIDDPIDPANRILNHWSVESDQMKNIYDGIVTLNVNGTAVVQMPRWFNGLNQDFRYQLTAIGGPAAGLYVSKEISNGQFEIAGGKRNLRVSWQVTGVRHDAAALNNHDTVEQDKAPEDRGKYLNPEAFGKPAEARLLQGPAAELARHPRKAGR